MAQATADPVPTDPMDPHPGGLTRAAVGGVVWQGLSYTLGKGVTLVTTIVLARLLTPDDFGLVTFALLFITFAEVVTDLGVSHALVFFPEERRRTDVALTISLVWSLALAAVAIVAAPAVGSTFGHPDVAPMLRVLALTLLISGMASVPDALLRKRLRFRQRLVVIICRVAAKAVASIVLAVMGFGAWAIAGGYVAGEIAWAIVGWIVIRRIPRPVLPRREEARPLLRYGLPAAGNALLLSLVFNVDYLIVGEALGQRALGFYTMAYRLPEVLILQALWVVSAIAFPLFSHVRDDPVKLRRGFLAGMRLQTAYGMAAGVGLAVVAPMLVPVVFGEKWTPAVGALQGVALYAVFGALAKSAMDLYKGVGRPGLAVTMSLGRLALVVPALVIGSTWGIEGVAWAHAAASLVSATVLQLVASRLAGVTPGHFASALVPALAVGVGVAVGAGAVRLWLPGSDVVRLAAAVAAGGVCAFVAVWLADRDFLRDSWRLVRRRPSRAPA